MREAVARSRLGAGVLEFLEAVVQLTAHPLGQPSRRGDEAHEDAVMQRALSLLEASLGDEPAVAAAAEALAADHDLLGAFFQSLDLLPPSGYPPADSIVLLIVMALGRLDE
jgi:hypothetical protein